MLYIQNVSKHFENEQVLQNFSLYLAAGEHIAIVGKSGKGKTTLLNIIAGFLQADSGNIQAPKHISMVFQDDRLLNEFSAIDNLRLVCNAGMEQIQTHLQTLGLAEHMHKTVQEYSGGMKRRLTLARAMLAKSELILLDEPFKGLDEQTKQSVMEYCKKNIQGKACILVTHDLQEAKALGIEQIIEL